jgi:AraC-like DNA-binding protein
MNDAMSPARALLARLSTLADCPRAGNFACITARREHGVRSVDVERPTIALVLQGTKEARDAAHTLAFVPGDLFLMAHRCRLDVVNRPDPDTGLYLTVTIPLCDEVIAAARLLWDEPVRGGAAIARFAMVEFDEELTRWQRSLQQDRYSEARLALAALVVALCRRGHADVLMPAPPSLTAQVRDAVLAKPEREWRSRDFESALGLSGATLRRHLASEGTSLRDVVAQARLACAITLLYTTRWPVKTVAAKVGYRSAATFSRRFHARYGLDPAQIGNAAAQASDSRTGTSETRVGNGLA